LAAELHLCICFHKLNKTNELFITPDFDLDQFPPHDLAMDAIQDMLEGFQLAYTTKPDVNLVDSQFDEVSNKYTQAADDPEIFTCISIKLILRGISYLKPS